MLSLRGKDKTGVSDGGREAVGGLGGWLLGRFQPRTQPRLTLVERISLAPRQSLALIEADGRRLLVATSADGSPAFYPLAGAEPNTATQPRANARRVSW